MKRKKLTQIAMLVMFAMMIVAIPIPDAAASVSGTLWYTTYNSSPNSEWDPAQSIKQSLEIDSASGNINFKVGLDVDVFQYKHDAQQDANYVTFKASTFFTSEATGGYVPAVADEIVLYVKKCDARYYQYQSIEVKQNKISDNHPYAVGSNMMRPSGSITPADYSEVYGTWYIASKNAVTAALGVLPVVGDIAGLMIDCAEAYTGDSADIDHASYSVSDYTAWSRWIDDQPGTYPDSSETVQQECFNVFNWWQKDYLNPSTYMKIKVYAKVLIRVPSWEGGEFSTTTYYTSPVYLKINHKTTSSGGGGCPILTVWDGEGYADEGLLDIHNPEGDDVTYTQYLSSFPEAIDGKYTMRLTEYYQTRSHIDQVKFYGRLPNGHWVRLRLLSAEHSAIGDVRWLLRRSDDFRVDLLGADFNNGQSEYIDLWFRAPNRDRFTEFRFVIEGNNIDVKI